MENIEQTWEQGRALTKKAQRLKIGWARQTFLPVAPFPYAQVFFSRHVQRETAMCGILRERDSSYLASSCLPFSMSQYGVSGNKRMATAETNGVAARILAAVRQGKI